MNSFDHYQRSSSAEWLTVHTVASFWNPTTMMLWWDGVHWGAPLVDLALLAQDGVPGFGEHISPLIPVHRLIPSFPQPHTFLNLKPGGPDPLGGPS